MSRLLKKAKTHYMHKLLSGAQGPLKITIRESRPSTQHLSQHHCYIKVRPCFQVCLQKAQPARTTTELATALAAETFPLVAGV
jgi:Fe-S-cluster-containing hydrogenase component 2